MFQIFVDLDIEISQHRKYCGAKKSNCAILHQISKLLVIVEQLPVATQGKFMLPFFIYAVLTQYPFCHVFCIFVWSKN